MNTNFFRFVLIPVIILIIGSIAGAARKKLAKPKNESGVQTPGRFDGCLLRFIQAFTLLTAIFAVVGFIAVEREMGIVFSVLTLISAGAVLLMKREYNLSYQENDEFFILNHKNKEYKVFYEDIVDWIPSHNEIQILDETRADRKYIRVNIAMIQPEILLRKIAEMTFGGHFPQPIHPIDPIDPNDPMREHELIHFYQNYHYTYLIEDYLEERNETSS